MRILMIISHFWPMMAGAEVFAKNTAEYLVKKGYQIDLVTGQWQKEWPKKEKINDIKVYRVKPWLNLQFFKTLGIFFPLYFKALQLIKVKNYDLVHCHIFPANIVGGLLKLKIKIPLISTIQGGDIGDYPENFGPLPQIFKPFISRFLKKADMVHVVSSDLRKQVKKMGVKNIKLVPNGVDIKIFKKRGREKLRKKWNIDKNKFVIISNSRLTHKNGLDILIKAAARLKDKSKTLVLLIGEGNSKKQLEKLVHRTDLCKHVKFLGYLGQEKIAEFLSLSDVFCRPSRQEGFGIAFLEAMAAEIPVIGTKVGGIPDFVIHKENGLLVAPESIDSLVRAIKLLKTNKKLGQKLGQNGRKMVLKKYTWEKVCPQIKDLYNKILK